MKSIRIALVVGIGLAATTAAWAAAGKATIRGLGEESRIEGEVALAEDGDKLVIEAQIEQAPPGLHGFHIHEFGSCEENGAAAGGHYNPTENPHGLVMEEGVKKAHAGDLGNIEIDEDGTGSLKATIEGLSLENGKYDVAGRAFILHEKPDDFGQPTGNAGGRIACGPIVITESQ